MKIEVNTNQKWRCGNKNGKRASTKNNDDGNNKTGAVNQTIITSNLEEFVQNKCNNLSLQQKGKVLGVLNKHESLFQGKRGEWTGSPVTLTLTNDAEPFRCSPYHIPLKQRNELEK